MAPVDPQKHYALHEKSKHNVKQLEEECRKLQINNNKLVNVIAQNNASKNTIQDLQNRLKYAQKNQGDKLVNFDPVNENLKKELFEAKRKNAEQEKIKAEKLDLSKDLQSRKGDLKKERAQLEAQLKDLEKDLNNKTQEATRIASKRIMLDEEIDDLRDKIEFERNHFLLMEQALKLDDQESASRALSSVGSQDFIDNILKEYAEEFGREYEKLMKKAQIREKALLTTKKERLDDAIAAKNVEKEELQGKLNNLAQEIFQNEKKLKELQKDLDELNKVKAQDYDEYIRQKNIKEAEVQRLQKENEDLKESIEITQKSANQALKVIIELEFEIKTYERLLSMEQGKGLNVSAMSQSLDSSLRDQSTIHQDQSTVDIPIKDISEASIRERKPSSSSSSSSSSSHSN